jgi:hypothetical protein
MQVQNYKKITFSQLKSYIWAMKIEFGDNVKLEIKKIKILVSERCKKYRILRIVFVKLYNGIFDKYLLCPRKFIPCV